MYLPIQSHSKTVLLFPDQDSRTRTTQKLETGNKNIYVRTAIMSQARQTKPANT
jgi:hypothetical protein